jgi:hypothetical protein
VGQYFDTKLDKRSEYVELVVIGDDPAKPVDLTGFVFDDNNAKNRAFGGTNGHIKLGSCFSAVMPGSIILLYDDQEIHHRINPQKDGAPNLDGVYQIPFNSSCLNLNTSCPSPSRTSYGCFPAWSTAIVNDWKNYVALNDGIDVAQVRNEKYELVHALMWWPDTTSNSAFPEFSSAYAVKVAESSLSYESVSFVDADPFQRNNYILAYSYTPGLPNSEKNAAWINGLKPIVCAGETITVGCEGNEDYCYFWSPAAIVMPGKSGLGDVTPTQDTTVYRTTINAEGDIVEERSYFIRVHPAFSVSVAEQQLERSNCPAETEFRFTASVSSEYSSYEFAWPNGNMTRSVVLAGGQTYKLTVTAPNGCTKEIPVTAKGDPTMLASVDIASSRTSICGDQPVQLTAGMRDYLGNSTYTYQWSNGPTSSVNSVTLAGEYRVTVTNNEGCIFTDTIKLGPGFETSILASGTQACAENPIFLTAQTFSDNQSLFYYEWSTGETSSIINVLAGGTYSVTVTGVDGCGMFDVIEIDEGVRLELDASTDRLVPGDNVTITPTVSGGTPSYTYSWSSGATSESVSVNVAGTYAQTVTDAFGCRSSTSVEILPFDQSLCEGFQTTILFHEPDCDYYGSARLESVVASSFDAAAYRWSTGETTADIMIDNGGQLYKLTVTASNGCQVGQTIQTPDFVSLNSLAVANDLCDLVEYVQLVSLADEQAILVMDGLSATNLIGIFTAYPNLSLEIIAAYEGINGQVMAVIPFASPGNVPDPTNWAGDLFDLPAETLVTISFQLSGWNYCPVVCPNTKTLDNFGATDEEEILLEENPPIRLTDYECGDVFEPGEENDSNVPLAVLNVGDVITVNGFPLLISSLAGGGNGTANQGQYTGVGIVPLPFNDRTVQVAFTNSFINENRVLKSGVVEGLRDQLSNYDFSMYTLAIGGDICVPKVNEDGFTEDGLNPVTGLDRFGFVDSSGVHSVTGTQWDENGFDIDGIHRGTGTEFNADGCNREGRDENDGECTPAPFVDPTAQAFMDSIANTLAAMVAAERTSQVNTRTTLLNQQVQVCETMRGEINGLIGQLEFQPDFIVGDSSQYLTPGLSKRFEEQPRIFPTYDPERDVRVVDLEDKHVKLYDCDVKELLLADTLAAFQGANAGAVEAYLLLQLSYLSADDIDALKVGDAFVLWVREKIAAYLASLLTNDDGVGTLTIPTPAAIFNSPDQAFRNLGTIASTTDQFFGTREEMIAYELNAQFNQGFRTIQGVHRAHFLARLAELREESENENRGGLLPLKVTKYLGGIQYSILLDDMRFDPANGASLSAYLIIEDPESGQKLVFEGRNISFGVGGAENARLSLASTVTVRISNAVRLILNANQNFVDWDCQGFVGVAVAGKVELCRDFITPLNEQTLEPLPDPERFAVNFEIYATEWLDAVVTVDAGAFAVTKYENIKWQLDSAVLDLSDHYTPDFVPTDGYASPHYSSEGFSPLWRGFYLQNLSATLPNAFSPSAEEITIGVRDVLIDDSGFTGEGYVEGVDILGLQEGSAGGWPFSIDRFNIKVLHNSLAGGGFGGDIILPVFTDTMRYDAKIYRNNRYKFTITPTSDLSMDMLLAKVTLLPASKIGLEYNEYDGFLAVADLTGNLKFEIPQDASINITMPELYFKEFRVSNRDPYFDSGVWEIRNLGLSLDFGGFGMDISRISPYQGETTKEMGLGFDLAIGLGGEDLDLSAGGSFGILGELEEVNQRQKWKFKNIDLKGLFIDANIKDVVHVKGALLWYKNNEEYGKGFQGLLHAKFTKEPLDFSTTVSAQFGKKGETKYFFVDAMVGLGSGIPIGPLNINGFGGGVSYHMDNVFSTSSMDFASTEPVTELPEIGTSFSGTHYFVAPEYGIGLKAVVMVATQKKELFNGWAGLEFLFNAPESNGRGGGLAKVSFKGQGQFMADILPEPPEFLNEITANLQDTLPISEVPDFGLSDPIPVSAWMDLTLNFNDNVFDGTLEAYLNAGVLQGAGHNNALVQAAMHVSKDKWYFNVGTPTAPAGILVDLPFFKAGATAYFNMGTDIPDFPGLPKEVASMARLYNNNEGLRKSGGGVMFGARIYSSVDLKFGPVRGFLNADLGFDLMLRNYGGAICTNTGNPIGINGWYASGQAWVYISGGVQVLGVSVAEFGLAGIMQARLPNPLWAKATFAAEVKLLFFKKRVNFNVEIGERCELEDENGEDIPENPVINYLNPLNKEKDIAVDLVPQVYFNFEIGASFTGENNEEYTTRVSRVSLRALGGNYDIAFDQLWENDNTVLSLAPKSFLPGGDSIRLAISVEVKKGNTVERIETRELIFYTAPNYDFIPASNVQHSYPVDGMYDFYPEEYNAGTGFIQLIRDQRGVLDMSPTGKTARGANEGGQPSRNVRASNKVLLESDSGSRVLIDAEYLNIERLVTFPLDKAHFVPGTIYRLSLVRTENEEVVRELLSPVHFRASIFSRFSEKIAAINSSPEVDGPSPNGLGDFSRQLTPDAFLGDAARIGIGRLRPLVKMQADLTSAYINELNTIVSDRSVIAACNPNYEYESDYQNLMDAAGVQASGSSQLLMIGSEQFSGSPFETNLDQKITYQVVNEFSDRFIDLKSAVNTCVLNQAELHRDFTSNGFGNVISLDSYLRNILGDDVVDFQDVTLPPPPSLATYNIKLWYLLPDSTLTSTGTISLRR